MKTKKITLIGGAGFIGHNMAIYLKRKGFDITIIDSLSVNNMLSFTNRNLKNQNIYWSILNRRLDLLHANNINLYIEDARNYNSLSLLLGKIKPDIIIHLAAVSHANKSNKDPHTTFDHTLRTLENTMDNAKSLKCRVIYFSSSMVYGNFKSNRVKEDTTCNPIGIYGTLKYSGELIVKAYHQVFDVPYTIIRPSALYGERCVSRRVGQIFVENAVQNSAIKIQGNGSEMLDFTYIEDLISGVELVIKNKNAVNETFNLTYGKAEKISKMAEILKSQFNEIEIEYLPSEKLNPKRGTLNIDKAKKLIGYNPKYPLEIGYLKYIKWYKKFWKGLKN